jgi:flagellar hook protein FlgE
LNTEGFKANQVHFKDVMGQVAGDAQIGAGVGAPSTARQFEQGSIQATQGAFDAAIQGSGFFVLKNTAGDTLYSRDGGMSINSNGLLVNGNGERVQGWSAVNGVLNATGPAADISVTALASQPPIPTTKMTLSANLNAAAANNDTFSTGIQVVDSLGVTHTLTVNFKKTAANKWDYEVFIPGEDVTGGTAGTPKSLKTGSLTFDSAGVLTSPAAGTPVAIAIAGPVSGAANMAIDWSLFDSAGKQLVTQYSQKSAASGTTQNGLQAAQVTGIRIADDGILVATYSSGKQVNVAQIALASIGNPDTLVSVGHNDYQLGTDTLTPSVGAPGTGPRGTIVGGSIESSNVDLAREFTNLIVYQRGYQANSKVITTIDQITQALLNIK